MKGEIHNMWIVLVILGFIIMIASFAIGIGGTNITSPIIFTIIGGLISFLGLFIYGIKRSGSFEKWKYNVKTVGIDNAKIVMKYVSIPLVCLAVVILAFGFGSNSDSKDKCCVCGGTASEKDGDKNYCRTHYEQMVEDAIKEDYWNEKFGND